MGVNESFEDLAQRAIHHAVAYRKERDTLPPRPTASVQELMSLFDVGVPEVGRDGVEVLDSLAAAAEPGLVGNISPNFFAWVMGASHPVGVAAEWMATAWGQNAAIYDTAPAAAVAEDVVSGWLLQLLDLPRGSSVGFSTGATMASFICLAAARSEVLRRFDFDLERQGIFAAPEIKAFLGDEAHTTIFSGLRYLGFGDNNVVRIETDQQGCMVPEALNAALAEFDGPKIVICQAGHINSGGFDPIAEIAPIAQAHNAWCHVDGAFGLWARAVPSLRHLCEGIDRADSWSVDGHKWLQIPYDSGFAIVKNKEAHRRTMDISASYLNLPPREAPSPSQFSPELSRRARGFAAWAVIQALGRSGIEEMISRHCNGARYLLEQLEVEAGLTVINDVVLNQLAIAFGEGEPLVERNRLTDAVITELARENTSYVTGAEWQGQKILRVSIISQRTDAVDIDRLGASIVRAWRKVRKT
ncbi:aspartate aminotransferase family protein [Halieaceae bacterium IMCC8485]|uniref:Aspartate aminotransferase family protein n=1 Tax=Candidatus Seongchinamella marina TaxID=2518990 RepID=A0ABT3SZN2_9GAMM|nr:pyridoxal-dependent decarboxylase [Candidatus Seongchinamella marina]MCX2975438.1 aspartate aminotransferase family protein [Candidatus Seongchinamella marina]